MSAGKSSRRQKAIAEKQARKRSAMMAPGRTSKYARKHAEQSRGNYRPTSPFYLPLSMREDDS